MLMTCHDMPYIDALNSSALNYRALPHITLHYPTLVPLLVHLITAFAANEMSGV